MGRTISKEKEISIRLSFVEQLFATGFFIGYVPVAPATWSCLLSIVIWYFIRPISWLYLLLAIVLFLLGVIVSRRFEKVYGDDPHCVVVDEYACFLLPLYFIPRHALFVIGAFVVFRIFDIIKPPPLRRMEDIPGGWGVMLDDLGAAVYTAVIVAIGRLVLRL